LTICEIVDNPGHVVLTRVYVAADGDIEVPFQITNCFPIDRGRDLVTGGDRQPPILTVEAVEKSYTRRRGPIDALMRRRSTRVQAVDGVSFEVAPGEVLGVAGESGSGKSVTGELITALQLPSDGRIIFNGTDVATHSRTQRRAFRRQVSMVFQDPYDALNPRMRVRDSVGEPLRIHGLGDADQRRRQILEVLERVGLRPAEQFASKYPHQLSGGERQRVAIARALVTKPKLLIADEPTTMLDVSVRTGVLNLLREMTSGTDLSMVFISHDFATLSYLSDRILIMYLGRVVEIGNTRDVLEHRLHPYTKVLGAAVPIADPDAHRIRVTSTGDGSAPPRNGCLFTPRCQFRMDHCPTVIPVLTRIDSNEDHQVACHLYDGSSQLIPTT